jgi:hypothetical protein
MTFDKKQLISNFYSYIKDNYGNFNGDYDELYNIYSLNYVSNIIDANTDEQNKQIAEEFGINTSLSDSYGLCAYYAYGELWNYIVKEFPLCEFSDAETDSDSDS